MAYENLKYNISQGIATISIDRADKMNALDRDTIEELRQATVEAENDTDTHAIIITGEGEKAFAAGADINEFKDYDRGQGKNMSENGHHAFNTIEACPTPVIAAVNGFALGGGCELAMACHLRVANEKAQFGQPEVGLGITPGYGGTQRLVQLIGKGKALELLMTGDTVTAQEAQTLGLVNKVTSNKNLMEEAQQLATKISSQAPVAIAHVIDSVNAYFDAERDGFSTEIERFSECFETDDFNRGTAAFLNKEKPDFKGA